MLSGCAASTARPAAAPPRPLDALAQLTVSDTGSGSYRRAAFGPAWADVDRNGCDTRNDILNRDLAAREWRAGTHDCVVIAGELTDPYTGAAVHFRKAAADEVQIDHVVSLHDAWNTGAAEWNDDRRREFANDPLNLLATAGAANQAKGDNTAAAWLPPNRAAHCEYVARQIAVKAKWRLRVSAAEHDALAVAIAQCPDARLPS
jgi:hypothetical protein